MKNKKIVIIVITVISTSLVAAIVTGVVYKKSKALEYKRYQKCVVFYESKQYSKAIELLNDFFDKYPESGYAADVLYRLAKANQKTNDYANAAKAWEKLIDRPDLSQERKAEAYYEKGFCQENSGNINAAIESYKTVTDLHIASEDYVPSAWYRLGILYEKDSKADAVYAYQQIVENYPEHNYTQMAADKLGNWNLEHFLNENTILYYVKSGDKIQTIARQHNSIPELIKKFNGLKSDMIGLGQTLRIPQVDFNIDIAFKEKILNLKHDGEIIKQYPICIGDKDHPTPKGVFKIINKLVNPEWRSPDDGRIVPPNAPDNELGTRWMGIANEEVSRVAGYGIHGTIKPESIGKALSRGCVRMYNKDVEELFDLVKRGAKVAIRDEIESGGWYTPNFAKVDE